MRNLIIVLVAAAALAACEQAPRYTLDPSFGNAVQHNMAQHIINPDPPGAENYDLPYYGSRVQRAMDKYERGEVKAPVAVETTGGGG
jgi:hypothetical protein